MKKMIRSSFLCLVIFALPFLALNSRAEPLLPSPVTSNTSSDNQGVQFVSQIGGDIYAVAVEGKTAYVGVGPRLVILDLSIPDHIRRIGQSTSLSGLVLSIAIAGESAYMAVGNYDTSGNGLCIVDISNPGDPELNACLETPSFAKDVSVSGQYAYVASYDEGIRIIDVSDAAHPFEAGYYDTPGTSSGISVDYPYAYVADGGTYSGLRILDVSDPGAPVEIGLYDTPGFAEDVQIQGDYAYVADREAGLRVINIANPQAPYETGHYTPYVYAVDVAVEGNYATLAGWVNGEVHVIDVSDPNAPGGTGTYQTPGKPADLAMTGNMVLVGDVEGGMKLVDITSPASPVEIGAYTNGGSIAIPTENGGYIYTNSNGGLRVLDVSNPNAPLESAFLPGISASNPQIVGGFLYGTSLNSLNIVDITNPNLPRLAGSIDTAGTADDTAVSGDYAFVTDWDNGLYIFNISDPAHPSQTALYPIASTPIAVSASGSQAYVTSLVGAMHILDISDPAYPAETGYFVASDKGYFEDIAVNGDIAYLATSGIGLQNGQIVGGGVLILDVSDPTAPEQIGFLDLSDNMNQLRVSGNYAYLTSAYYGVYIIDIANPSSPVLVDIYNTPGEAGGIAVADNYLYAGDGSCGLIALWFAPPINAKVTTEGGVVSSMIDAIEVEFPAGGFTETVTVTLTSILPGSASIATGLADLERYFDLTATDSEDQSIDPTQPYTITIQYTDDGRKGAIEESLGLYTWNDTLQQWQREPSSLVDVTTNRITAKPEDLSRFAVFGETRWIYIPILYR